MHCTEDLLAVLCARNFDRSSYFRRESLAKYVYVCAATNQSCSRQKLQARNTMAELNDPLKTTTTVARTTPTQLRRHSVPIRGLGTVPSSTFMEGRFGRMFRNLPVFDPADDDLKKLAERMIQP